MTKTNEEKISDMIAGLPQGSQVTISSCYFSSVTRIETRTAQEKEVKYLDGEVDFAKLSKHFGSKVQTRDEYDPCYGSFPQEYIQFTV